MVTVSLGDASPNMCRVTRDLAEDKVATASSSERRTLNQSAKDNGTSADKPLERSVEEIQVMNIECALKSISAAFENGGDITSTLASEEGVAVTPDRAHWRLTYRPHDPWNSHHYRN